MQTDNARPPTVTPSMAHGVRVTPRLPDFAFHDGDVPEAWFDGDVGITAAWNGLSVIAGVGEALFVASGRWLLARIDDPAVADETARFMQQEAIHAAVHARLNKLLAARGLPVEETRRYVEDLLSEAERRGGHSVLMALGLAGEQAVGELAHAVLASPASMDGAAPAPRALYLWHWYEEVEHQAALHDGWTWVHGQGPDATALRALGAVYAVAILGAAWPATTWAMVPAGACGARWRLATWRPLARQMFGDDGLLSGAGRNLRSLLRADFHPFDMHDPAPVLERFRDAAVRAEWEVPAKEAKPHGPVETVVPRVGPRDAARAVGFMGWVLRRTARYLAAVA